jgi:hypothetical protein
MPEAHFAVDQRKQGMVAAHANVPTGSDHRPTLANQNRTGQDRLAITALDPETLTG